MTRQRTHLRPLARFLVLGVVAASAALPSGVARAWTPGPAVYDVGKTANVPVTMADGTVLRADINYPVDRATGAAAAGPFPVILTQTPYGKTGGSYTGLGGGANPYLVQRGYIHVVADIRGTGGSQGAFGLFGPAQVSDGVALVNWSAALPHSNGKVGTLGLSYLGIIQLMTAAEIGPDSPLKAIFPIVAANDLYRDIVFQGGVVNAEFNLPYLGLMAALNALNPVVESYREPAAVLDAELQHLPGVQSWQAMIASNILTGGDLAYDEAYWESRRPREILDKIVANGIPAFLVGGWYDVFQRGALLNYSGLQNAWSGRPVNAPMLPDQTATGRYQLLVGPWFHVTTGDGFDLNPIQLRWFDTWLKDSPTGIDDTTRPLHLYEPGADRWVDTSHYPLTEATPETYYLGAKGSLTTAPPAAAKGADTILFTGASSPCSLSTEQWGAGLLESALSPARLSDPCAREDRTLQLGPGALTYTTAPFTQTTAIAGPIGVTLYASSTRPDALFVATIEDISPNGGSRPITTGALLGSFRALDAASTWTAPDGKPFLAYHPFTRASVAPVTPGEVTRFDIEVNPAFARLLPGHRLRLTITTSDTPHLLPTPHQLAGLIGGVYRVQRSAAAASFVEIPLAPDSAFDQLCSICLP